MDPTASSLRSLPIKKRLSRMWDQVQEPREENVGKRLRVEPERPVALVPPQVIGLGDSESISDPNEAGFNRVKGTEREEFQCQLCSKWFTTKRSLKRHLDTVHRQRVAGHRCDQCSKCFGRRDHLILHQKHHRIAKFKCTLCHLGYETQAALTTHTRREHGSG